MSDVAVRFLAQVMGALKGLIFLPLIARNFGGAAYGIWTQISLTVVLLQPLISLQLHHALVRYLTDLPSGKARQMAVWSVNWVVGISGAAFMALGWFLKGSLASALFGSNSLGAFVFPLAMLASSQAILSTAIAYYRAIGEQKLSALIQVGTSIASIGTIIVAVIAFHTTLYATVIAWAVSIALGGVLAQWHIAVKQGFTIEFDWKIIRRLLRYSLPLIPALAATWVIEYSDRLVIVHILGLTEAGIYTGAYRLAQIMRMFMAPVVFVLLPTLLSLRKEGDEQRAQDLMQGAHVAYLVLACGAAVFLISLGPQILTILGSEGFRVSQSLLALLVIGEALLALRLLDTQLLYLSERTPILMIIIAATAALNLVINLLLVPRLGILGAAIGTFVGYAAQWIGVRISVRKASPPKIEPSLAARIVLGAALAYCLLGFTTTKSPTVAILGVAGSALIYAGILWSSGAVRDAIQNRSWQ